MTILAVDDHIGRLEALAGLLREMFSGDDVVAKSDPLAAGKLGFGSRVDVLFSALEMKWMDGLRIAEFVRHGNPAARVFLLGSPEQYTEGLISDAEIDGWLNFPVTKEGIIEVLKTAQ